MPQPRCSQITLADTPFYHCVSRCVRRSLFVWYGSFALDSYSGQSYQHRRAWVDKDFLPLASIFSIDNAASL
jgi:hypothetical protein